MEERIRRVKTPPKHHKINVLVLRFSAPQLDENKIHFFEAINIEPREETNLDTINAIFLCSWGSSRH